MAIKKLTDKGFRVYFISMEEQNRLIANRAFGGICDNCMKAVYDKTVVYIPVLNWGMCESCFENWYKNAEYFPEDEWYSDDMEQWAEEQFRLADIKLTLEGYE